MPADAAETGEASRVEIREEVPGLDDVRSQAARGDDEIHEPQRQAVTPDPFDRHARLGERRLAGLAVRERQDADVDADTHQLAREIQELFLRAALTERSGDERHAQAVV